MKIASIMDSAKSFTIFRICCLHLIVIATILMGTTLRQSAVWDEYKTIVELAGPSRMFRVDGYQNLWEINVRYDDSTDDRVYPLPGEPTNTDWRDSVLLMIVFSVFLGCSCFVFLLLSTLLNCSIPQHKLLQMLSTGLIGFMCFAAGTIGYLGTKQYRRNYQTILRAHVLQHPEQYNTDENIMGVDFWMSLVGSATYGLAAVAMIALLFVEIVLYRKNLREIKVDQLR